MRSPAPCHESVSGVHDLRAEATPVVCAFIMPLRAPAGHCARGRDELCETFFAMNRLRGTLYDGTTRLRREDGTPLAMYSMAGLAEYAVVPATDVFAVSDGLDLASAAVLGCAVFTAYGAVATPAPCARGPRRGRRGRRRRLQHRCKWRATFGARQVIAVDVDR